MPFQPASEEPFKWVALLEVLFFKGGNRQADVVFLAVGIGEAQVHEADFVFLDHLHYVLSVHFHSW